MTPVITGGRYPGTTWSSHGHSRPVSQPRPLEGAGQVSGRLPGRDGLMRFTRTSVVTAAKVALAKGITHHIEEGIRERLARAAAAKKRSDAGVAAGREFVEAYVEFTHYVERLHLDATTSAAHGAGAPAAEHKH